MLTYFPIPQDPIGQLPPAASSFAGEIDGLFLFLFWISVFFFALITGLLVYSSIKHRRKSPDQVAASNVTHNTPLEVVWTLIPTIILMVIFAWGFKGNQDQLIAPADALQYSVHARQWAWQIYHPDAKEPVQEMWVPVDTDIKVTLTSEDVLHAFFIPAFRIKRDVVPGVRQLVWFRPTRLGDYDLFCAEYCGDNHSGMHATVHVVPKDQFNEKLWNNVPTDPVERGHYWYQNKICFSCHTTDGTKLVGPSFKGIWMRKGKLADGSDYVADEAYIRHSIHEPSAQIVAGFGVAGQPSPMPQLDVSDDQISDIIAWMKTLK